MSRLTRPAPLDDPRGARFNSQSPMRIRPSVLSVIPPVAAVVVGVLSARAASNLLDNSPFLPATVAPGAGQDAAPLELRSILKEGADYEFSLYDPAKKQSTWARLNEGGHDFMVKAFDPTKEMVTIEVKNRSYRLTLKESKIALLAMTPGATGAIGGRGPMMPGGQPAMPGMAPPDQPGPLPFGVRGPQAAGATLTPDQLRNLEADINRRRELRRQAAAAQAASTAGQPATSSQQQ